MVDNNKTTTYSYNERGQLIGETDTLGSEKTYSYDLSGNRKTLLVEFNNSTVQDVSYNYDNMGRLTQVLDGTTVKASYTYDINGNRQNLTNDNGTHTEYTYNLANSLKMITNYSGQTAISGETYTYYLNGNIYEKVDQSGRKTSYLYDDLNRLKTEVIYQNDVEINRINYLYDDYNNRISKQVVTPTETYSIMYYYDDMNRLESTYHSVDGTTTYTYDTNGNTLSEISTAKTTTYKYNSLNELESTDDGNKIVAFAYDGNRLRISKSVDGTTLQFLNDRDSVIAEILGTDITVSYLRGINLISMTDPQGAFEWYYHYNYHGDVTELTDSTGTVVKSYKYDAFGIEENIDASDINPFRYTTEYFDKETDTIYLRARYYNPAVGRFLNQDSYLGNPNDPLSLNLYTYVHNNPVMGVDPSGHNAFAIYGTAGGFALADGPLPIGDAIAVVIIGTYEISKVIDNLNNNFHDMPIYDGDRSYGTSIPISEPEPLYVGGFSLEEPSMCNVSDMPTNPFAYEPIPGIATQQRTWQDFILFENIHDWNSNQTLEDHYERHGADVNASSQEEYAKSANEFYKNRNAFSTKVDTRGNIMVYDYDSKMYGVYTSEGKTRTYYKPSDEDSYWERK